MDTPKGLLPVTRSEADDVFQQLALKYNNKMKRDMADHITKFYVSRVYDSPIRSMAVEQSMEQSMQNKYELSIPAYCKLREDVSGEMFRDARKLGYIFWYGDSPYQVCLFKKKRRQGSQTLPA